MRKALITIIVLLLVFGGAYYFVTPQDVQLIKIDMGSETAAEQADVSGDIAAAAPEQPTPAAEEVAPLPSDTPPVEATATPESTSTETAAAETAKAEEGSLLAAPKALQVDLEKAMADRTLGNADAPVTIIEYASMTCSHCAHFHNDILPSVKKSLIENGKAKLIFRDFPLDQFAIKAAAMARCAPAESYFDLIEVIFKNQERWAKSSDPEQSLKQYGALAGMEADYIDACMKDEALQDAILKRQQEGQEKYKISATPTFVFNDGLESFNGARDVETFVETVNKISAGK